MPLVAGRAVGGLFLLLSWSTAFAAASEELLGFIDSARHAAQGADEGTLQSLHDQYRDESRGSDRALIELALGTGYAPINPRLALQYLTSARRNLPAESPVHPFVDAQLVNAKLHGGDYRGAGRLSRQMLDARINRSILPDLFHALIGSSAAEGDHVAVIAAYREYQRHQFAESLPQSDLRLVGEAMAARGMPQDAFDMFEDLARHYPTTDEARWAFRRLLEASCDDRKAGPNQYRFSVRLLSQMAHNRVLGTGLEEFLVASLDLPVRLAGGVVRTMTLPERLDFLVRARMYRFALAEASKIYELASSSPVRIDAGPLLYQIGYLHLRLHEPTEASRYFSRFLASFPQHRLAPKAWEGLGDAMRYLGLAKPAAAAYREASEGSERVVARWQQFWALYRGGDLALALGLLERPGYIKPRRGDEEATVAYWHARILARLGRSEEAQKKFLTILADDGESFYAQFIARTRRDVNWPKRDDPAAPPERHSMAAFSAKLIDARSASYAKRPELQTVQQLLQVGLRDLAARQLSIINWAEFEKLDGLAGIGPLAMRLDDYTPARRLRSMRTSSLSALPRSFWDIERHQREHGDDWRLYLPIAYASSVTPVARALGVDPLLLLSVMRRESFYNRAARSAAGAVGIMQLMPYTAAKIAALLHDGAFDAEDLRRPEINLAYAGFYLNRLLRYYGGNILVAVAAYNSGPIAVNRWLQACKDCEPDEFVESIPFRETRHYVREVLRNYAQYGRLYAHREVLRDLGPLPRELPVGEELF